MKYTETIKISSKLNDIINKYLSAKNKNEYQDEDKTITITAKFTNGYQMDIQCCGCQNDSSWTQAMLFDKDGQENCCTEVEFDFTGTWELHYKNNNTYIVNVVIEE